MTTRTELLRSPERWLRAPGPMVWRRAFPGSKDQVPHARKSIEGLFTVAELATTIDIHGSPTQGHTVWAELDLTTKTREELAALPNPQVLADLASVAR